MDEGKGPYIDSVDAGGGLTELSDGDDESGGESEAGCVLDCGEDLGSIGELVATSELNPVSLITAPSNLHVPFSRWYLSPLGFKYDCERDTG